MEKLRDLYDRKQLTRCEFRERELVSRHEAIVRYEDSHRNGYEMRSTLDFDLLRDTTRVETYTIHDLAKRVKEQCAQFAKIATHLENFGLKHKGIWVYPSDADAERQYWNEFAERIRRRRAIRDQHIDEAQARSAAELLGQQPAKPDDDASD
jgi:hypothetical protein